MFGVDLKRGDRVRLWPQKTSDIMDMALAGQVAEIESIEIDYDEKVHLAVILDDDPGKDLGALRQPGHRFFFSPEEVEPLALDALPRTEAALMSPRILVAGVGNIFLGDDAFGVEVTRRLMNLTWPEGVMLLITESAASIFLMP